MLLQVDGTGTAREAPADLTRHGNLGVELLRKGPHQARVLLEATANHDVVQAILLQQLVGQHGAVDGTDRADGQLVTDGLLDRDGEGSLEARAGLDLLGRVVTAGADVDEVDVTLLGEDLGELDGVLQAPAGLVGHALLEPLGGRDTQEDGHGVGNGLARELGDFEGEADAVLEATTVLVGPLVGDRGQEGEEEVAVGVVDLNEVGTGLDGTLDGSNPGFLELLDVLLRHLLREREAVGERDVAGALDVVGPATRTLRGHVTGREPWGNGACLATSVGNLNTDDLALAVNELDHPSQRLNLRVLPQTTVLGGNASLGKDSSGLDHQKTRSTLRDASQVGQVPVGHVAILSRVLAKRRKLETRQNHVSAHVV